MTRLLAIALLALSGLIVGCNSDKPRNQSSTYGTPRQDGYDNTHRDHNNSQYPDNRNNHSGHRDDNR